MVTLLRLAACSVPLLIGLTSRCFAHWARASCAPRHCHPYQFPLKSCGFSGAETVRKRFLLWKMGFSAAKIAPSPPYTPPGTIVPQKGFRPLTWVLTVSRTHMGAALLPLRTGYCTIRALFAQTRAAAFVCGNFPFRANFLLFSRKCLTSSDFSAIVLS